MIDKEIYDSLPTKERGHHNNEGYRQIKRGQTRKQVALMARRIFKLDGRRMEPSTR